MDHHDEEAVHNQALIRASRVVSGESDGGETDELYSVDPSNPEHADPLFDNTLDDEDEAYVYRNMRSGIKETITVVQNQTGEKTTKRISVYKPRYSDAQLQCPCCFQIVCMDCQRHTKYQNQFRAMFVMGIVVDWHSKLVYDDTEQALVPKLEDPNNEEPLDGDFSKHVDGEYFSVLCANCHTQVAALDMEKEVYHFHGCLESS